MEHMVTHLSQPFQIFQEPFRMIQPVNSLNLYFHFPRLCCIMNEILTSPAVPLRSSSWAERCRKTANTGEGGKVHDRNAYNAQSVHSDAASFSFLAEARDDCPFFEDKTAYCIRDG